MTRKTDNQKNLTSERSGPEMLIALHPKMVPPTLVQKKESSDLQLAKFVS